MRDTLTAAKARELLSYEPETGVLTWLAIKGNRCVGDRAGSVCGRYRLIGILGRRYREHRVAWLLHYGEWPKDMIDHIDGDRYNNRIANLRDVTNAVNGQNKKSATSRSSTGLLGVQKNGKNFQARINKGGKYYLLGTYKTPEEAHAAYVAAKRELHEGCTI